MRNFRSVLLIAAIFGLGVGAAFGGGQYCARRDAARNAPTPTPAAAAGAPAGPAGGFPGGAAGGPGGAAAAAPTTGAVEEVTGDTVTIRTQAGGVVVVKISPETRILQSVPASPSDLRPGLGVVVQGQPEIDGRLAARSVQITGPASPAPGMGGPGGRPGGGPGASPSPSPAPRP